MCASQLHISARNIIYMSGKVGRALHNYRIACMRQRRRVQRRAAKWLRDVDNTRLRHNITTTRRRCDIAVQQEKVCGAESAEQQQQQQQLLESNKALNGQSFASRSRRHVLVMVCVLTPSPSTKLWGNQTFCCRRSQVFPTTFRSGSAK